MCFFFNARLSLRDLRPWNSKESCYSISLQAEFLLYDYWELETSFYILGFSKITVSINIIYRIHLWQIIIATIKSIRSFRINQMKKHERGLLDRYVRSKYKKQLQ